MDSPFRGMWAKDAARTIGLVPKRIREVDVLHWSPRLVALAAALALILIVLGGLGLDEPYNLYW
jgi:hypothetical protein